MNLFFKALLLFFFACEARADLYLSHFFVVLDDKTWDAMTKDPFLKDEFAEFTVRTIHSGSRTWTGAYMMGQKTYVELFRESQRPPEPDGVSSEINFGVERVGEIEEITKKVQADYPNLKFALGKMLTGESKPWMKGLEAKVTADQMNFSVLEYELSFMETKSLHDISRKSYNSQKQYRPERYFKDVIQLTAQMTSNDFSVFEALLKTGSYKKTPEGKGFKFVGPEFTAEITDAHAGQSKIISALFSLNREKTDGRKLYSLGQASLEFLANKTAILKF